MIITGGSPTNGIDVTGVTSSPDSGVITVNLNISKDASLGDRTLKIINPDGKTGIDNSVSTTLSNFVTYKYIPVVDINTSTTTVMQGFSGEITIKASSTVAGQGFDPIKTPTVSFTNNGDATDKIVADVAFVDTSTLHINIKVPEKAITGKRTVTITNPSYETSSTYDMTITSSPYNISISSVSPNPLILYQGQTSTVTIIVDGKLEDLVSSKFTDNVIIGGLGLTVNGATLISGTTLWLNLTADKKDNLGERTITIKNPTYNVTASTTVIIATSSYSSPEITSVKKSSTNAGDLTSLTLYQGDEKDITITGKGFWNSKNASFSFTNSNITVKNTIIVSSTSAILTVVVPTDMAAGSYGLIWDNTTDFGVKIIKQDLLTISEKHDITSISPSMLAPDRTEYFYINGTNFVTDGSTFTISIDNKIVSTSTYDSSSPIMFKSSQCVSKNQISCQVYVSTYITAGVHDLSLYFASNGSTVTKRGILLIPNKPVILNIPSTVSQNEQAKEVTIQGQNFESGATVVVSGSGINITTISVISSNIITFSCNVDAGAEKTDRQIKVINPTGQFATGILKVIAPPTITSCSPASVMKGTTRYLEVIGQNFNEYFKLGFSGKVVDLSSSTNTTWQSANIDNSALNILSMYCTGDTEISANVYIGTGVVSGKHDIEVINYDSSILTEDHVQSKGIGAGLLDIRTPLQISNDISAYKVPTGLTGKTIRITGDGFSKDSVISVSGTGVNINAQNFTNTKEIEIAIDVADSATLEKEQ